ncbi:hypothetical protein [Peribacillus simplex]|uniref:hypothetical protein n=1 Tax=Peribacillus simplex TaxID=1478 RepID=UPI003670AB02
MEINKRRQQEKWKILKLNNPRIMSLHPEFKESVELKSDVQVGDEFTYLQVRDDLENTTKETVIFNGIETAVPDNGKPSCLTNVIPIKTPKLVPFLIIKPLLKV